MWNTIQVVGFLLCVNIMCSFAQWIPTVLSEPVNAQEHPDGFWFGTQNMDCLKGKKGKRSVSRNTLLYAHRLIYYRGLIFEWGVRWGNGELGYSICASPFGPHCEVSWEARPAATSTCGIEAAKQFARSYKSRFGNYNLIFNNCHTFANRLAGMLQNGDC